MKKEESYSRIKDGNRRLVRGEDEVEGFERSILKICTI